MEWLVRGNPFAQSDLSHLLYDGPLCGGRDIMAGDPSSHPCVLLVDDAADEREMYAEALRAFGCNPIEAAHSVDALQLATTVQPDIVVTDVHLAGVNGFELTRWLRRNAPTKDVPVIVLTSMSRPQDHEVAIRAGADAFLLKPVLPDVLMAEIRRILASSRRPRRGSPQRRQRPGALRGTAQLVRVESNRLIHSTNIPDRAPQHVADDSRAPPLTKQPGHSGRRMCPQCRATLDHHDRHPVLTTGLSISDEHDRIRYETGWFCSNPSCDYRELTAEYK